MAKKAPSRPAPPFKTATPRPDGAAAPKPGPEKRAPLPRPAAPVAATPAPKKIGRPSKKTPEMVEAILDDLYEGLSLRSICQKPDRPILKTIMAWFKEDDEFRAQYLRAHEAVGMMAGSMILDVTRACLTGSVDHNVARVVIHGLQTSAAQMAPKLWGQNRQEVHHSGEVKTGVLMVPGMAASMDDWVGQHGLDGDTGPAAAG